LMNDCLTPPLLLNCIKMFFFLRNYSILKLWKTIL
jgi:hypothetical protein